MSLIRKLFKKDEKNWTKRGKYKSTIKIIKNKSIKYQEKNMDY